MIITLPGSPKAVRECTDWLLGTQPAVLLHALKLVVRDRAVEGEHRLMQGPLARSNTNTTPPAAAAAAATATVTTSLDSAAESSPHPTVLSPERPGCGCDHGGTGTRAGGGYVSAYPTIPQDRQRISPWPVVSLDQALFEIDTNARSLDGTETVPVDCHLVGRILAEDIEAPYDLPSQPTSNMDGYAILASCTPAGTYVLSDPHAPIAEGKPRVCAVNTGMPLPVGTDAVVPVEETKLINSSRSTNTDKSEQIELLISGQKGDHVRSVGSDVRAHTTVLRAGTTVSALGGEIGTAAFVGRTQVQVRTVPKVVIFSTGDEIVDVQQQLDTSGTNHAPQATRFRVMDTNRPSLLAAVEGSGLHLTTLDGGILKDDAPTVTAALHKMLDHAPDVVISTGGTSMGQADVLKPVLERELKATIHFGRVHVKPGKPTAYATLTRNGKTTHLFTLPGNPASALVCYYLMVLPALRKLAGVPPAPPTAARFYGSSPGGTPTLVPNRYSLPRVKVQTLSSLPTDPRPEFHRAIVMTTPEGQLVARSTGAQRSSGMHSMATANALLCVPPRTTTEAVASTVDVGTMVDAILLGPVALG